MYVEIINVVFLIGRKKFRRYAGLFFSIITSVVPNNKELNITTNTRIAGKR